MTFHIYGFSTKVTCKFHAAETWNAVNRFQHFLRWNNDENCKGTVVNCASHLLNEWSRLRLMETFYPLTEFKKFSWNLEKSKLQSNSVIFSLLFNFICLYFLYLVSEDPGIQWFRSSTWVLVGNSGQYS